MKLRQLFLKESGDVHSFVFGKWDGQEAEDLFIQPFDVLVKYHGEAESSSDHPYGEGDATETHGANVTIVSLTADEVVHVTAEAGHALDSLNEHSDINAVVLGPAGPTLERVKQILPDATVLKGKKIEKGTKGALEIFSFLEDHPTETIIIDVDISPMLDDIFCVTVLKAALSGGTVYWKTSGQDREFEFSGRLIIVTTPDAEINDGIDHRVMTIDVSNDKKYPRGTPLQSLPGWDESHLKFFEDKAYENFTGNTP